MTHFAKTIFGFGFVVALALSPGVANAQKVPAAGAGLITAVDPQWLTDYLVDFGYEVELDEDDEGEPIIVGDSLGADFIANFDSCTDNVGCTFVIFSFYWDPPQAITPAKLNEWNSTEWYGQAHNAEDGAVGISFATTLEGGVHEDNISATVTLWDEYVGYFEEFIGITGDPGGKTPPPTK